MSSLTFKSSTGANGYTLDQSSKTGASYDLATILTKENGTLTAGDTLELSALVQGITSGTVTYTVFTSKLELSSVEL